MKAEEFLNAVNDSISVNNKNLVSSIQDAKINIQDAILLLTGIQESNNKKKIKLDINIYNDISNIIHNLFKIEKVLK